MHLCFRAPGILKLKKKINSSYVSGKELPCQVKELCGRGGGLLLVFFDRWFEGYFALKLPTVDFGVGPMVLCHRYMFILGSGRRGQGSVAKSLSSVVSSKSSKYLLL